MAIIHGKTTYHLYEDPELHLIHTDRSCPDAKVAVKYNYLESLSLAEGDIDAAKAMDERAVPCLRCHKAEGRRRQHNRSHKSPPGFRTIKYARVETRAKKNVERD